MKGSVAMETKNGVVSVIVAIVFILTIVALPLNAGAEEIRIDSIGDKHIGTEVTVSGIIIAISSNIEPSTSEEGGIQTFEPGDTGVLTIDDGTGTIFVSCDPELLEEFYEGQRVMVTGIYSGEVENKGIIYASTVSADLTLGYTDVTVKELNDCPTYYYAHSVRIQGDVMRIKLSQGETELEIDDDTGIMDVEYRAEMENITIGDYVIVEGKFYRNKIYAFAVGAPTPEPSPTPTPSPTPSLTPSPTPSLNSTSLTLPAEEEEGGMPLYLIVAIIAGVAAVGIVLSVKVREWFMLRRYGE
jgi:hypothetical protein